MKSSIKVDTNYKDQAVINIVAFEGWEDLRDKTLSKFLTKVGPRIGGRLCFIDSSGSKNSGSTESNDGFSNWTITPIDPEHYELLIKEIEILIKERDSFFGRQEKERESFLEKQKQVDFNDAMNY